MKTGNIWKLDSMTAQNQRENKMDKSNDQIPRTATIMFIDLVGSSEVASLWKSSAYREDYLKGFHETVNETLIQHKLDIQKDLSDDIFIDYSIRGDELLFIIASEQYEEVGDKEKKKNEDGIRRDIIKVFSLALGIKYR